MIVERAILFFANRGQCRPCVCPALAIDTDDK